MAVLPFFKIEVQDSRLDISDLITSFSYDRSSEKDDILKVTLNFDKVEEVDNKDFVVGKKLVFKYGIVGDKVSKKRVVKIKTAEPNFASKLTMTLVCHDKGTDIKKTTAQRIFKGKTSSEIATIIADEGGYGKNIEVTNKVWKDMPQGNKSEFELLQYLADREDNGDFIFYVSDNTMNFVRRDLKEDPIITYTYNDGEGEVISFKPSYKEAESSAAATTTKISDQKVEISQEEVNLGEQEFTIKEEGIFIDPRLDPNNALNIDINGIIAQTKAHNKKLETVEGVDNLANFFTGKTSLETFTSFNNGKFKKAKEVVTPTGDKEEAVNLSKSIKKKAKLKSLVATLVVELNPLLEINKIVTMAGVGQKYSGNWYITDIGDVIGGTGKSTLQLKKNSTKKSIRANGSPTDKGTVNKKTGPKTAEAGNKLIRVDTEGRILDDNGKVKSTTVFAGGGGGSF